MPRPHLPWDGKSGAQQLKIGRAKAMANITVNGEQRKFNGDPNLPLLWYLRDEVGLTGTKFGCGVGACGACTIHLDGEAVRSCLTTIEHGGWQDGHHHRGLEPRRRTRRAEGMAAAQRSPVRLLPGRADHAGGGSPHQEPRPLGRGDRRRRCPAISADAVAISAFMRRSVLRREGFESCCIIWSRKRARRRDRGRLRPSRT